MHTDVEVQQVAPLLATEDTIPDRTWQHWFSHWLEVLAPQLSPIQSYSLCLRLTDDSEIQQLNATYRSCDRPTDVLAFAALETLDASSPVHWQTDPVELGDIIISLETALRQAPEHEHSMQQELAWLASHGLLHLLGWDHPDDPSLAKMLKQQADLLSTIHLM